MAAARSAKTAVAAKILRADRMGRPPPQNPIQNQGWLKLISTVISYRGESTVINYIMRLNVRFHCERGAIRPERQAPLDLGWQSRRKRPARRSLGFCGASDAA